MTIDQQQPRIAPLGPDELGPDAMETIAGVLSAQSLPSVSEVPEFIAIMVRHRELFQRQADMSATLFAGARRTFLALAFLEPGKEPTEHLLNELISLADRYNAFDCDLVLAVPDAAALGDKLVRAAAAAIPKTQLRVLNDRSYLHELRRQMGVGDERLPFAAALDGAHRGLYAFSNYNVGTGHTLLNIFSHAV